MAANLLAFMVILTVEDEFLISEYLRTILEAHGHKVVATLMLMQQSARWKDGRFPACHHGYQYAGGHGWAAAGCGSQRKVAADPSDSRDGVYTAEAQRAAFGKLVCAETYGPRDILTAVAHFQ